MPASYVHLSSILKYDDCPPAAHRLAITVYKQLISEQQMSALLLLPKVGVLLRDTKQ